MLQQNSVLSLTQKLYLADEIRQHEKTAAEQLGIEMYTLMERAGEALFQQCQQLKPEAQHYLVVVGVGNNAGDGYVAARCALKHGKEVILCAVYPQRELSGDAGKAQSEWLANGGEIKAFSTVYLSTADIVIDALLGTGAKGQLREEFTHIISAINAAYAPIVSADIPSGLCANTGKNLGQTVQATRTLTFVGKKLGTSTGFGKQSCGDLIFEGLGISDTFSEIAHSHATTVRFEDYKALAPRKLNAHKSSYGRLLCVGGNTGMSGAIRMCAEAALRTGAGMVKVFTHCDSIAQVSMGRPELMVSSKNLEGALNWATCIVLGPGLGQDEWAKNAFNAIIEHCAKQIKPLMLDADALNLIANDTEKKASPLQLSLQGINTVMTPHAKEASRLMSVAVEDIESDRFDYARKCAMRFNTVCVLKGAGTIIDDSQSAYVCENGNPGMATAGMGDVLSGVIGALLAQSVSCTEAARYGVCIHAKAADLLADTYGQRGLLATDLFTTIRELINR